jgi:thioredoxin-like negative regulator of GroEL
MDVTTETFQREVIERSAELPVVVDFWAVAVSRDGEPVTGFVSAQRARVIGDFFDEQVLGEGVDERRADVRPAAETSRNRAVPTPARKEVS